MNAALNSGTASSRPAIWRRSKAHQRKLFKRFVIGLPIVTFCGWEYRVWKRKLYYTRNREHFPGSTPFYGKMWGYESDYMIETSLQDGDLVFWAVDPLSVHVGEAMARFAYRHIKGDYDCWDFCGVILKLDGKVFVATPHGDCVLYSDLVADHRTTSLVVRTMIDTSPHGEERLRIKSTLSESTPSPYLNIGIRGFMELSLKAIIKKYIHPVDSSQSDSPASSSWLERFIRPESLSWPLPLLSGVPSDASRVTEISELFMDPLIFRNAHVSFAPPFFVRRLDNEYYTHNRTKNIVVDWNLLQQRDEKNKRVARNES